MFGKKKIRHRLQLGLDLKRCADCERYLRPCEVDGKVCTFHRFIDEDQALLRVNGFTTWQEREKLYADFKERGICPVCCTIETVRRAWALVEYPDGSLGKVAPEEVCFLDKEH